MFYLSFIPVYTKKYANDPKTVLKQADLENCR